MTKLMFGLSAAGWLAAGLAPGAPADPAGLQETTNNPGWARVTLPYAEWVSLWETARVNTLQSGKDELATPPVAAFLLAADYELALADDKAVLNASYEVRSLSEAWNVIPLLGGEVRLEEADTGQAGVLWKDGKCSLLSQGPGDSTVRLRFRVPAPSVWTGDTGVKLIAGAASLNRLRVSGIPKGQAVRIQGLTPTEAGPGAATYHLPGEGGEVILSIEPDTSLAPPVPSTWEIQSEVLVRYQEGQLLHACRLYAQADEGSGLSLDLWLPQNAQSVVCQGEDLAESRLGRRENGVRPLQLRWKTRDLLDRKVEITYAVAQSPLSTEWTLHAPRVLEQGKTRTLFAILGVEGLALSGQDLKDSVQSRRLPEWLRERIGLGDFLTVETGAECVLRAGWLPRLETAQATISLAEYDTRLVADGALLVEGRYTVAHASPLNWRLELPDAAEVLTCQLNDKPVQPVKRGEKEIEFALGGAPGGTTKIGFCYATRLEKLDPVSGRIAIDLPRTDLFIHALQWALTIPAVYETTAIEGNVAIDDAPAKPDGQPQETGHVIHLKKELLRAEHPTAEIYYQRRGLSE